MTETTSKSIFKSRQIGGHLLLGAVDFFLRWKYGDGLSVEEKAIFFDLMVTAQIAWGIISRIITTKPVHIKKPKD